MSEQPPDKATESREEESRTQERDGQGAAESDMDAVDVRDLLREALREPKRRASKNIAAGVQQRIRQRSGGRFFADGWSTTREPRALYLVTSLLMLLVVVLAWFLLTPLGFKP